MSRIAGRLVALLAAFLLPCLRLAAEPPTVAPLPLVLGETFVLHSERLGEERRINVFLPAAYSASDAVRLPVLYMPDGGVGEDFPHIAGLVQIGSLNGTMRPMLLVGIENTQRRRDLTGPTEDPEDRKIAPVVGGSAAFRAFLRDELRPVIDARYRTSRETAIVGESLAGLFVVETFFVEPDLFDTYVAVDPSLWWNREALLHSAAATLEAWAEAEPPQAPKAIILAHSDEKDIAREVGELGRIFAEHAGPRIDWHLLPMPEEKHGTLFHPAALRAFRTVLAPPPEPATAP